MSVNNAQQIVKSEYYSRHPPVQLATLIEIEIVADDVIARATWEAE